MLSMRTWIIIAVAVLAAWWFFFRKPKAAMAAPATVSGQPAFQSALVPKLTLEPMATQGTQTQRSKIPLGIFDSPLAQPKQETALLSPRSLTDKAASMYAAGYSVSGNPPPPPPPPSPSTGGVVSAVGGAVSTLSGAAVTGGGVSGGTRSFSNLFQAPSTQTPRSFSGLFAGSN
jgi:hypothetical protein